MKWRKAGNGKRLELEELLMVNDDGSEQWMSLSRAGIMGSNE